MELALIFGVLDASLQKCSQEGQFCRVEQRWNFNLFWSSNGRIRCNLNRCWNVLWCLIKLSLEFTCVWIQVEQLHKIFKLCGTPSEEYWRRLKLSPTFKPPQSYRPSLGELFKHLPSSCLGLLSSVLALDPSYRGSASLALENEVFNQT